jgi:glycosyltransferase involved in cell wall biosynthesis
VNTKHAGIAEALRALSGPHPGDSPAPVVVLPFRYPEYILVPATLQGRMIVKGETAAWPQSLRRLRGPVYLLGSLEHADGKFAQALLASCRFGFSVWTQKQWHRQNLLRLLPRLVATDLLRRLRSDRPNRHLVQIATLLRRSSLLRRLWSGIVTGHTAQWAPAVSEFDSILSQTNLYKARDGVLMVTPDLAAGGAERQLTNTALGLRRRGHEVSVIAERALDHAGRSFFSPVLEAAGIAVQSLTIEPPAPPAALLSDLPAELAEQIDTLYRVIASRRPSVVHGWQDAVGLRAAIAAHLAGTPRIVIGLRNVAPIHFSDCPAWYAPAYRALAVHANVIFVVNSQAGILSYADWLSLPPARFQLLRNGIDIASLQAATRQEAVPARKPYVIGIFRLADEKQPHIWLEAAARIATVKPDLDFIVIGDGPLQASLRRRAAELGMTSRLQLLSPRPNATAWLLKAELLMLASDREGTPNVLLEALALGIPAVACVAGGTAEALPGTFWAPAPVSPTAEALAGTALAVLNHPGAKTAARCEGGNFVAARYGLERMLDETVSVYGSDLQISAVRQADGIEEIK